MKKKKERFVRINIPDSRNFLEGKVLEETEDVIKIIDEMYGVCNVKKAENVSIIELDIHHATVLK